MQGRIYIILSNKFINKGGTAGSVNLLPLAGRGFYFISKEKGACYGF